MNRTEAINELKAKLQDYLESKGIDTNKPGNFTCLNPDHADKTPSMHFYKDSNTVHCHGCQVHYNIFDLIGIDCGLQSFNDQLYKAAELYGVAIDTSPYRQKTPAQVYPEYVDIFAERIRKLKDEPIFITDTSNNSMSIELAGGMSLSIDGADNILSFLEAVTVAPPEQAYILSFSNNRGGKKCNDEIYQFLRAQGYKVIRSNLFDKYTNAVEALQAKGADYLAAKISEAIETSKAEPEEAERKQYEQANQARNYIDTMRLELEKEQELPTISTGFKNIDSIINGGLYPGLYFIGAISSLGKTTFALQIADNVAKQGQDVLIISLEMAKRELIAKSVSRETAEYSAQVDGRVKAPGQTTADIMTLKRQQGYFDKAGAWQEFTEEKKREISATVNIAFKRYSEYANHIFICEGVGDITPQKIKERVEEHKAIYGTAPVVIVDYLQIMAGESDRLSDKQKVDKGVVELKRLSRDFKIPVIAISSVNRASYNEPITMESFKESGGIEFSSDILIGLQYKGMDYQENKQGKRETEKDPARLQRLAELRKEMREIARAGNQQPIQVKILKNRNGSRGSAELRFYPMFNYFKEWTGREEAEAEEEANRLLGLKDPEEEIVIYL